MPLGRGSNQRGAGRRGFLVDTVGFRGGSPVPLRPPVVEEGEGGAAPRSAARIETVPVSILPVRLNGSGSCRCRCSGIRVRPSRSRATPAKPEHPPGGHPTRWRSQRRVGWMRWPLGWGLIRAWGCGGQNEKGAAAPRTRCLSPIGASVSAADAHSGCHALTSADTAR